MDGRHSIATVLSAMAILAMYDVERVFHEGTHSGVRRGDAATHDHDEWLRKRRDVAERERKQSEVRAQQQYEAKAAPIRAETLSRKEHNFRKRLPRGHPDRIE